MKVLWICNIMLPAIAEKLGRGASNKEGWLSGLCDTILEHQQENKIELYIAYPVKEKAETEIFAVETGKRIFFACEFTEDIANAEKYDEGLEQEMKSLTDKIKPEVIHCFGTEFAHTLAALKCGADRRRVLIGLQGICGEIAEAYMADLPEEVQKTVTFRDWLKKDSIREQQNKFRSRGRREQEILRLACNVAGRTEFDKNYALQYNEKINYFRLNETMRPCFYSGQWNEKNSEAHTIFISQGDYPLKGLHYLLLAAAKLKRDYPDLKIKVAGNCICGYRTLKEKIKISAYGRYLYRLIADNRLQDTVCFLGSRSGEEMKTQLLGSGLYVCCSSNENSPNSLGEAMLLGVPCVAADVGGISSLFTGGQDGILYPVYQEKESGGQSRNENSPPPNTLAQNTESLYQAIKEIWENPEKRSEYCKNARNHAINTHNREKNYMDLLGIYAEICGSSCR